VIAPASKTSRITLVPFGQDPLVWTAQQILVHYQKCLPDLSTCQILVAEDRCAPRLRTELLRQAGQRGFGALLGPSIERLDQWFDRISAVRQTILNRPAQELVLAAALRDAAPVYADTDPWLLAEQLLTLFDEITRYDVPVADELERFEATLSNCYALGESHTLLQQEAGILHTLWHAWQEQLAADQLLDPASAYRQQLRDGKPPERSTLWLAGFTQFTPAETNWLRGLLENDAARLILHGGAGQHGYHPDAPLTDILERLEVKVSEPASIEPDALADFVATLFEASEDNLKVRAQRFARLHPQDPVCDRLSIMRADDPEQEGQTVALQIRSWLLEGRQPIALVTEDRRIARRVRALLEASAIQLDDPGGWALSTTSAAATLERWLETVEEDFAAGPLLDVLKSPFVSFATRDVHLGQVRRLEQDIILHENIARGLQRYRHHLDKRSERLPEWSEPTRRALHRMLNLLDHAASPLVALLGGKYPAEDFLAALRASLVELGAWQALAGDAAGLQLLEALEGLHQAGGHSRVQLDWPEFRAWLGRHLERTTFQPPTSASPVQLLTLEQTRLQHFAAVIIAGCSREHLPGTPAGQAFFNQRVRAELGLPTWSRSAATKLHHFCRILHAAPQVLLTCHREQDGEPVSASPWLDLLDIFYSSAYGTTLENLALKALADRPEVRPAAPDQAPLPGLAQRPAPRLEASIQPQRWSAYTHQRLIDCPYRFFAADALNLKPQDEIRAALSKSDYGSLVHRIVQAFNSEVPGLPGPWSGSLTRADSEPACALLRRISAAVFEPAINDNFQARGWYRQWLRVLPHYLDWEIQRRTEWHPLSTELKADKALGEHLRISGRIDRLDQRAGNIALLDYKTGRPPRSEEVLCGEAVQLPSYALLIDQRVVQLDYLEFARDKVSATTCAAGETLDELLSQVAQRLTLLTDALHNDAPLPAWGDVRTCAYCEFGGICRREMWSHHESGDD
jgi:ATP-dependent helicase/nuclease subunit B